MSWTDERVERLRKLWNDGLSATRIAAELGRGLTRNAVIGKIHRLGLAPRAKQRPKPVAALVPVGLEPEAKFDWTERPTASLTAHVKSGLSIREIVVAMSEEFDRPFTAKMIERKRSHLGLSTVPGSARPVVETREVVGNVALALAPIAEPAETIALPVSGLVALFDLRNDTCRWPIGTPGADDFHFCGAGGASLDAGRPYCSKHAAAATSRQFTRMERQEYLAKKKVLEMQRGRR